MHRTYKHKVSFHVSEETWQRLGVIPHGYHGVAFRALLEGFLDMMMSNPREALKQLVEHQLDHKMILSKGLENVRPVEGAEELPGSGEPPRTA